MAEQLIEPGNAPAKSEPTNSGSLILAMHARYEAAWRAYNLTDAAQPSKPKDGRDPNWIHYYRCEAGMAHNSAETELIRLAICYQVPGTDEELTALAFHVSGLADDDYNLTDDERSALAQGLSTMLDYLVREGRADMEKLGGQFSAAAMLAFHRCRYRTGVTAED